MTSPRRRTIALASVAAVLDYALWDWFFRPVGGGLDVVGYPVGRDFIPMWAAPHLALTRGVAVLTDFQAFPAVLSDLMGLPGLFGAWSYPPTALLLLMPFSLLPYGVALVAWTAFGWLGSLKAAWLVRQSSLDAPGGPVDGVAGDGEDRPARRARARLPSAERRARARLPSADSLQLKFESSFIGMESRMRFQVNRYRSRDVTGRSALLLLALSPALWLSIDTGQNGAVLAALLAAGLALLPHRPGRAGLLFGLMTVKPHLGIALAVALLALRAWRALAASLATAAALALAATLVFGPSAWSGYTHVAMPYSARILAASHGGQKLLLASLTSALTQAGWSFDRALAAQGVLAALVLVTLVPAMRRTTSPLRRLALVAAATPLVSPYVWTYDLVALGAALCLRLAGDPGRCPPWVLGVGYLAPGLSMAFEVYPGVATAPAVLSLVFVALSWEALMEPRPSHEWPDADPSGPAARRPAKVA